jgi:hypothetical protein
MAAVTIQTEAFTTDGDKPEVLFIVAMEWDYVSVEQDRPLEDTWLITE